MFLGHIGVLLMVYFAVNFLYISTIKFRKKKKKKKSVYIKTRTYICIGRIFRVIKISLMANSGFFLFLFIYFFYTDRKLRR